MMSAGRVPIVRKADLYMRLVRLNKPTGIFLLFWPCAWAIFLSSSGNNFDYKILFIFLVGSILMRSAGCIVNDLVDRKLDNKVERTKARPIASGEISVREALQILVVLLSLSFILLLFTNKLTIILGIIAIIPVVIYPFMKRIINWPQLFLGFTFNMGALMGWTAVRGEIDTASVFLYMAGIFWTLGYDTIYAHQDKKYDVEVGIKSSAIALGSKSKRWIYNFYNLCVIFLIAAGVFSGVTLDYHLGIIVAAVIMLWQIRTIDLDDPKDCNRKFKMNIVFGLIVTLAITVGHQYW